jgi:hypothetical protein
MDAHLFLRPHPVTRALEETAVWKRVVQAIQTIVSFIFYVLYVLGLPLTADSCNALTVNRCASQCVCRCVREWGWKWLCMCVCEYRKVYRGGVCERENKRKKEDVSSIICICTDCAGYCPPIDISYRSTSGVPSQKHHSPCLPSNKHASTCPRNSVTKSGVCM